MRMIISMKIINCNALFYYEPVGLNTYAIVKFYAVDRFYYRLAYRLRFYQRALT